MKHPFPLFLLAIVMGVGALAAVAAQPTPEESFAILDKDHDGKLNPEEFGTLRAVVKHPEYLDQTFRKLDVNGDGSLSFEEFRGLYQLAPQPAPPPSSTTAAAEDTAFFEKHIRPVLADKCYKCHATDSEKIKGGLLLDTREGIRTGGDTGPAVVPRDLTKSLLVEAIRYGNKDLQMPPEKSGGKLPDAVIADFEQWVKMGAPDPREGKAVAAKSSWDYGKARDHWAFKAPQPHPAPAVKDAAWPRTDIDRFVLAGLKAKDLKPVADADPRTLIRRIYFDLIGLPPSPEEVDAFLADKSPRAVEKVVDRLLASPRFGERWGRHWLDVARYAESTGRDVNATLPYAWRYRDYVIDAFNADKPYDQFIREQIAGDLLPAKDDHERAEHLIATGFLALGSHNLNDRSSRQFALDMADEQIDTVSQAVLGLTVACARCHDHKFDPIPQRDYYALAGIFLSTETRYGTAPTFEHNRPGGLIELPADCGLPHGPKTLSADERAQLERDLAGARKLSDQTFTSLYGSGKPPADLRNDVKKLVFIVGITARVGQLERELAAYDEQGNSRLLAVGVADYPTREVLPPPGVPRHLEDILAKYNGRPREFSAIGDSALFTRGDAAKPGEKVPRGFIGIASGSKIPAIPATESGRRELADWLVARDNPLAARVFVNRVWHWMFGRGLVSSVDNFGTMGQLPANQALLDHLALAFQENGWSVKKLIREIALSHAYQLASTYDETDFTADPENALVWRMSPRRLDAECIRDAMLAVSGTLQLQPPVGSAVARLGDGALNGRVIRTMRTPLGDEQFLSAAGSCRSVYLPVPRNAVPDALAVFDFAEANAVTGARDTTTVPGQALYLLNSEDVGTMARRFAGRLLPLPPSERVDRAFNLAFARPPATVEKASALKLFQGFPGDDIAAWEAFCRALFGSAEFRILN